MEVIESLDATGRVMVCRVPENGGGEIKWGAQLTVRESQSAVFFRDGMALDVFSPGRYVLETHNIPILTKMVTSLGYGSKSPFRAEVVFVNMKLFNNLKWGTREPILFRDSELQAVRIRAFGIYSIQINDPQLFVNKIVGTQNIYRDKEIEDYLRNIIISKMTDVLGNELKTVYDIPKNFNYLTILIKTALQTDFDGLGLNLHDLYIGSISLPEDVQSMVDARGGMSVVRDLDDFVKFKAANALDAAANNQSGNAATGVGLGAGIGMGQLMPYVLKQTMESTAKAQNAQGTIIPDNIDKIKRLKELLDMGAISEEEFKNKKTLFMKDI